MPQKSNINPIDFTKPGCYLLRDGTKAMVMLMREDKIIGRANPAPGWTQDMTWCRDGTFFPDSSKSRFDLVSKWDGERGSHFFD